MKIWKNLSIWNNCRSLKASTSEWKHRPIKWLVRCWLASGDALWKGLCAATSRVQATCGYYSLGVIAPPLLFCCWDVLNRQLYGIRWIPCLAVYTFPRGNSQHCSPSPHLPQRQSFDTSFWWNQYDRVSSVRPSRAKRQGGRKRQASFLIVICTYNRLSWDSLVNSKSGKLRRWFLFNRLQAKQHFIQIKAWPNSHFKLHLQIPSHSSFSQVYTTVYS